MFERLVGKVVEAAKKNRWLFIPAVVCLALLFAVNTVVGAVKSFFSQIGGGNGAEARWKKQFGVLGPALFICGVIGVGVVTVSVLASPSAAPAGGTKQLTAQEPQRQEQLVKPVMPSSAITASAITTGAITPGAVTPGAVTTPAITQPAVTAAPTTVAAVDNTQIELPENGAKDQQKPEETQKNNQKASETTPSKDTNTNSSTGTNANTAANGSASAQQPASQTDPKQTELVKTVNKYVGMLRTDKVTPSSKEDLDTESGVLYYTNAWMAYSQLEDDSKSKLANGVEDYLRSCHKTMTGN